MSVKNHFSVMAWEEKAGSIENQTPKYSWSQTIGDVTINLPLPHGTSSKQLSCVIKTNSIQVKVKGQSDSLLDGELCGAVKPLDSTWTIEDQKMMVIQLEKQKAHDSWNCIIKGEYEVDGLTKENMDKKMLLEKFQREHPGFDFSGATMTGKVPDDPANYLHPSTFDNAK